MAKVTGGFEGLLIQSIKDIPEEKFRADMQLPLTDPAIPLGTPGTVTADTEVPAAPVPGPGLWDRFSTAYTEFGSTFGLMELAQGESVFTPTPGWRVEDFPEIFDGVPEEQHADVIGSSPEESLHLRNKIVEENAAMQRIMQDSPLVGTGLLMGAALLDPATLVPMVGEAKLLRAMGTASRAARAATAAGTGAALGAAEAGILAANKETYTASDVVVGAALGAGLGGLVNAFTRSMPDADDLIDLARRTEEAQGAHVRALAAELDNPARHVDDGIDLADNSVFGSRTLDELKALNVDQIAADLGRHDVALPERAATLIAEAARRDREGTIISAESFQKGIGQWLAKNPAMSDAVALLKTNSPVARLVATEMLENASGVGGRKVNTTAAILKLQNERKLLGTWMPEMNRSYRLWAREEGIGFTRSVFFGEGQERFAKLLRMEMEARRVAVETGTAVTANTNKHVRRVADALDAANKRTIDMLKQAGVRGADDLKYIPGYIPLRWSGAKLAQAEAAGKLPQYRKLLAASYRSVGIAADDADRISNAVITRSIGKHLTLDANPARMLSKDSRGFLETILRESNMSDADVKSMMLRIDGNIADRGKAKALKSRVTVDLNYSENGLSLMDIVDNDIATLMSRNNMEMSGRAALARKGITDEGDWQVVRETVARQLVVHDDPAAAAKALKSLDAVYDEFMGRPIAGGVHVGIRRLMEATTVARLGQVGFAQAAETANIIASHGLLNTLSQVPQLLKVHRQLKKAAKTGDYSQVQGFMDEIRVFGGQLHDEHMLYRPEIRLNDRLKDDPSWLQRPLEVLDRVQASAGDTLGYVSGLYKIKALQQQATVLMQTQKVISYLASGKGGSDTVLARFADVGWDAKTLDRIKKNMKHIEYLSDGKTINRLNLEKWDARSVEDFVTGLHRHTHQLVQLPMVGERAAWQSSDIGALFAQFKTFSLTAIEKQAGRNYHNMDGQTIAALTYGSALSVLAVTAKVYVNSIGRADRDAYLKERLDPKYLIGSMVQYSGMWGPATDIMANAHSLGISPIPLNPSARGGAGIQKLESFIPAADTALDILNVAGLPAQKLLPWNKGAFDMTGSDVKDIFGIKPLGNTIPMTITSNLLQRAADAQ